MPKLAEREYRSLAVMAPAKEKRIESNYYVEGYAARFERYPLYDFGDGEIIYEEFDRDCFAGCDMSDIIMQYDHRGKVFARTRNNTLIVEPNDNGLFMAADLSKSEAAKAMYEEIANGLVDRMSWAFMPGEWHFDEERSTIVHTKIKKIFDVSAVSMPANEDTTITADINARSSALYGEIQKQLQELREKREKAQTEKEKLLLKLKLGGF